MRKQHLNKFEIRMKYCVIGEFDISEENYLALQTAFISRLFCFHGQLRINLFIQSGIFTLERIIHVSNNIKSIGLQISVK